MAVITRPQAPGFEFKYFVQLDANNVVVAAGESGINTAVDSWDNHTSSPDVLEVTDNVNVPPDTQTRSWHAALTGQTMNPDGTFTPPVPAPKRIFSRVEFMRLFSMTTFLAIDALETAGDPGVRYFLALLRLAEYVDLDDPSVAAGLQQISAQHPTALSSEEAARVLAGEPPE